MFVASALPLTLAALALLAHVSTGGYELSAREKNALICIAGVVGKAIGLQDVASGAKAEELKAAIRKEADRQGVAVALKAKFDSEAAKMARIETDCYRDGRWHEMVINNGMGESYYKYRADLIKAEECTKRTAEGLATLAIAEKILTQQCGKGIQGADEFMSALVPSAAITPMYVLGEMVVALCYDDFTDSLDKELGQCDLVGISCKPTGNAVTEASLSISCTKADKKSEITAQMLSACGSPGSKPEGKNKYAVLELLDLICNVGVSGALAKETDPKRFQELFAKSFKAEALWAVVRSDEALGLSPKVAKNIEEFFRKPPCNSEDLKVIDCDKVWPAGPSLRGGNDCTLDLTQLIEMNKKRTDGSLRRARLIRSARGILCSDGLKDKSFKIEKPSALAKVGLQNSELEKALEKAVANIKTYGLP